ncbi:membrane protein [Candidatus Magnetomorum sp. HK-1]|nr:membrane protein [Candidatus Magnetomorum sp. HK-1]
MTMRLIFKTYIALLLSYLIARIMYDRIIFGYLDLRVWALLELVIIPIALTVLFWLTSRIMNVSIRPSMDKQSCDVVEG